MKFWTLMYPLVNNTSKPNTHLQAIMRPHFRFLTLGSTYILPEVLVKSNLTLCVKNMTVKVLQVGYSLNIALNTQLLNLVLNHQVNECVDVPKEVCSVEQVNPRQVSRPIIKKWCTRDPTLIGAAALGASSTPKPVVANPSGQDSTNTALPGPGN